jgi:hypothetical protein
MFMQEPRFSSVVCNHAAVRGAFGEHGATRRWWLWILRLHGKPVDVALSRDETVDCLARGFHFYASLYRALAALFLLLALLLFHYAEAAEISLYWCGATLLAGIYLWLVSGLGYSAARAYRSSSATARLALLGFMVMIVAFLAAFVAAISLIVEQQHGIHFVPNLGMAALLFVFGIGSYMIEILYLAADVQPCEPS